tara:strand:+ start:598 stop:780 length:183 start_codon:yes stop_codon:yes gene_type:complete
LRNTYSNSTKISYKYLGDFDSEAIHSLSGSFIHADAPKDHGGNAKNFTPINLLPSAFGSF